MTDVFPPLPAPRQLPGTWTSKARKAAARLAPPVPLLRRIASPASPISYAEIMRRGPAWRIATWNMSLCAIDGCEVTGEGKLVFDHCHDHGWLRGIICCTHNYRLGQIDAVRRIPGARLDFSATPYAALLAACPGCVDQPEQKTA